MSQRINNTGGLRSIDHDLPIVRVESTGIFGLGETVCKFDDQTGELIKRTRPTLVERVSWPLSVVMPGKVEDLPTGCPRLFQCESCVERIPTNVEISGASLLAAERMDAAIRDGLL
jgi:hypothetical protein